MIIQYAVGKFWQPLGACRSHLCLLFCLRYSEYFVEYFPLQLLCCITGTNLNFLLPTAMIMFPGFGILITGVKFPVNIGFGAASSFGTSGSASSLTRLSFTISDNGFGCLYTSAGASLTFILHLDLSGISPTLQIP